MWNHNNDNPLPLRRYFEALMIGCISKSDPKGNQPWIFIERTDAEAEEAPVLWRPDAKSQLFGKDSDDGKDWGREEKGAAENEMVGWHHRLNGHEFEQTLGGKPGVLWFTGSQRVRQDLVTEQQHSFRWDSKYFYFMKVSSGAYKVYFSELDYI